jgi:type I restriction enzyme, S subunit
MLIGEYRSGSVLSRIVLKDLKRMKVILPPKHIIDKFDSIAAPMSKYITSNLNQGYILNSLIKILLPKLLSGKIRV